MVERVARPLDKKMQRIEALVAQVESCGDPRLRDTAKELLGTVMDLHGETLSRLAGLIGASGDREEIRSGMDKDPLIKSVLLLHGLHPRDLQARVNDALEEVRPALKSHHGNVELVSLEDNVVKLRLVGTCNGCPASSLTFKNLIETTVFAHAPEIESIQVDGIAAPTAAPLERVCV